MPHSEGQLRTRLKLWGIRKPRRGTGVTVADVSTGQNDDNPLTGDASFDEDDVAPALQTVEDRYVLKDTGRSLPCSCAD